MIWNDTYSLGIEEIDNQHKELLRLFSVVQDALQAGKGWSEIHFAVLAIIDFAHFHFQFEEALMRLFAFPELEAHSKSHRNFRVQANAIVGDSLRDRTREDVAEFFRDWLVTHIQGADRAYAEHILGGATIVGKSIRKFP